MYVESATDPDDGVDTDITYDELPRKQRRRLTSGFENFGNLLRYDSLHELAGEDVPMDHCLKMEIKAANLRTTQQSICQEQPETLCGQSWSCLLHL